MLCKNRTASLLLVLLVLSASAYAAGETKRVLLLAGKGSHGPGAHEHVAGMRVLEKCLQGVPHLETSYHRVGGPWPEGPELIRRADGIVMYMDAGMQWEQADAKRQAALAALAARGGGIVGLHWAVGGKEAKYIPFHLKLMGGCHGGPDRKYTHTEAELAVAQPNHPILRGIGNFRINDEFYYQLKWAGQGKVVPLLTATIQNRPNQAAAWAFERPDGGRSFGFVCLHSYKSWSLLECRRLVAQAVLWTVHLPVPEKGLPVKVDPETLGGRTGILAPGAKVEKLADGFKFTEGPAADAKGNVFFTDQPNDRILKWSTDGKLSTFMQPCGRSNGLCFDTAGNLWACADEKNQLWRIDPSGKPTVVVKDYQGKLLNGPNDVWVRPDGGLYFTDPFYKRPYWNRGPQEQPGQCVYYLAADRRKLTRVTDDLVQPNGVIGTADGKTLYVADIRAGKTYAYDIRPDGSLAGKRLFCKLGSDGMTIDNEQNVYLTGKGVTVFDPSGKQIEHIAVDARWTANVCFGGRERRTLFITAGQGLYAVGTRVRGVGSQ